MLSTTVATSSAVAAVSAVNTLSTLRLESLEKLPVGSLNSFAQRVRTALLQVFLPRLCPQCQPKFADAFNASSEATVTANLIKILCNDCKINYVNDRRAVKEAKKKHDTEQKPIKMVDSGTKKRSPSPCTMLSTQIGGKPKILRNLATTPLSEGVEISSYPSQDDDSIVVELPVTPPPEIYEACKKARKDHAPSTRPLDSSLPIYQALEQEGKVHWCRYCGATGKSGWKLGPWGENTLCHRHGCEFLGFGFARTSSSRLAIGAFRHESRGSRTHPIVQDFCCTCWNDLNDESIGVRCHGCSAAYHSTPDCSCPEGALDASSHWYCSQACQENFRHRRVKVNFKSTDKLPYYIPVYTTDQVNSALQIVSEHAPVFKIRFNTTTIKLAEKRKRRKYRKHDYSVLDRVVSFIPVRVDPSVHQHAQIFVPQWRVLSAEERCSPTSVSVEEFVEDMSDDSLLQRHARYEEVEKNYRLLKPGILEKLVSGQAVDASQFK